MTLLYSTFRKQSKK